MADRELITKFMTFTQTGAIVENYNSILFTNFGTVNATIGGFPLPANPTPGLPGATVTWSHNANEVNMTNIIVDFPNGAAGALVWAIITYYKDRF